MQGTETPRIAVSACLLGENVRYNGGHCNHRLLKNASKHIETIPICPEMGIGLGSPRPTIRLVRQDGKIHLVEPILGSDLTDSMLAWSELQSDALMHQKISGIVLKKDSPSCGIERVKVYENNNANRDGKGLFAMVFTNLNPQIPAIEEGRLNDPLQLENFFARVGMMHRWWQQDGQGWTTSSLQKFHAEHKLLLQSRSPNAPAELGRLISQSTEYHIDKLALKYITLAQHHMDTIVKKKYVAGALRRAVGRLPNSISGTIRKQVHSWIDGYVEGTAPRMAPIAVIDQMFVMSGLEHLPWKRLFQPFDMNSGIFAKL
jgi:uncharacterized protein YbbK (DUF523 family)/uncharacterized protein YbgA (DUF1722 family)